MQDFRNLHVWQRSHSLTLKVYRLTAVFPSEERYGLIPQMRRCALSIPSNLAEGCGRGSDADFGRFVQIALGSASELEYQMLLAHDLTLVGAREWAMCDDEVRQIKMMLSGLLTKLRG